MRKHEKGLTILETALALTLISSFMAGLFMLFRSQQETVYVVLGEAKGPQEAMRPLSMVSRELANLKTLTLAGSGTIRYTSISDDGATIREISQAPADPSNPWVRPLQLVIEGSSAGAGALPSGSGHAGAGLVGAPGLDTGEGPMTLSADRLIQNHNPDGIPLQLRGGKGTTNGPVPIFTYLTAAGEPTILLSQIRRVEITLVIRPTPESAPRYVRTSVALRNP